MSTTNKKTAAQTSLFDKDDYVDKKRQQGALLQIKIKEKKTLSKAQKRFNTLVKNIADTKKEIETTKALALELSVRYHEAVKPLEDKMGKTLFDLAATLDVFVQGVKLTKKEKTQFSKYLQEIFSDALDYIEPNEEQKTLFDKYSKTAYDTILEEEKEDMLNMFLNFMKDTVGVEMEADDFDFDADDHESAMNAAKKIKAKMDEKEQQNAEQKNKRTKSKAQIEREQQRKLEAEMTNKSIRAIYISLAKALHPDTETDESMKSEKLELMKRVTAAYDKKDLPALLKLETEWMQKTTDRIDELTDEKLKLYNKVLQEQLSELRDEVYMIKMNPAYFQFSDLLAYTRTGALATLNLRVQDLEEDIAYQKNFIKKFKQKNATKLTLINHINEESMYDDEYDDDEIFPPEIKAEIMKRFEIF